MLSRRPAALYSRFKTVTFDPDNEYRHSDYKFDQFKRLKRIKQGLLWVSGLGFIILKRADVNETLQFLWSCYVSKRHDQPFDEIEKHYRFSVFEIGDTVNQFAFVMAAAYCAYVVFALLCPAEDKDELSLEQWRREAEKNYQQLKRETRLYETAQDILKENQKLRGQFAPINNHLIKLQERLVRVRLEITAIESVQSGKTVKKRSRPEADLFETAPSPPKTPARTIRAKRRLPKRRRNIPKF